MGRTAAVVSADACAQSELRSQRLVQSGSLCRWTLMRTYRYLISDCVHCGFCLPACPTYVSWGDEMDSPRGRIDLMKGVHDGVIALDAPVIAHFDACLGCMACVTACPSGVQYDVLIESTRATVEAAAHRSPLDRLFRNVIFAL